MVRFFEELTARYADAAGRLGLPSLEAAIGRIDLLEQVSDAGGST